MHNLGDLLKQHKRFFPPNMVIRETLVALLTERFEQEPLTRQDVRVQGRIAYVTCSPLLRSEIMLNKKELLEELRERIAPHIIDDIR